MLLALLMLVLSLAFLINDYRLSEPAPDNIPREKSWARSGTMPDIMISGIEIQPLVPQAGESFVLNIFCQNIGIIRSGLYDLEVSVRDRYGNEVFSGKTSRNRALDPGQTGAAFSSSMLRGDIPGRYTVSVSVIPYGFEDSNLQNNRASKVVEVR